MYQFGRKLRQVFYVAAARGRQTAVITSDRERLQETVGRSTARRSASELLRGKVSHSHRGTRRGLARETWFEERPSHSRVFRSRSSSDHTGLGKGQRSTAQNTETKEIDATLTSLDIDVGSRIPNGHTRTNGE